MENVEDIYPLSPLQEGILFHAIAAPGSGVFVTQVACRLDGALDVDALRRACAATVARHPALRSAFPWDGLDEPLQVVRERVEPAWTVDDWRPLAADDRRQRLTDYLERDRAHGFDLAEAPLLRLALFRTGDARWRWVWTFHHLIADGWSTAIVLREVFAAYRASLDGAKPRLDEALPYRELIAHIGRQDPQASEAFWREELRGFDAPTSIRTWPGPRIGRRPKVGQQASVLTRRATDDLGRFAAAHRLTLPTVAAGAWSLLLGQYAGETDVVFGMTTSGRPADLPGAERGVGLYINTLPLRVGIDLDAPVTDWLARLQERQMRQRRWEHSSLAAVQRCSEIPPGEALFESILVFENYPTDGSVVPDGSAIEIADLQFHEQSNYPLAVLFVPGERLETVIVHDRERFDDATVARMLEQLAHLLESLPASGATAVRDLAIAPPEEMRRILAESNRSPAQPSRADCIHHLFEAAARESPERVALASRDREVRYAALDREADRIAVALQARGVGPGVRVGLLVDRSPEMVAGALAVLKAGGAYVPVDPGLPDQQLRFIVEDAAIGLVLTQAHLAPRADALAVDSLLLDDATWWAKEGAATPVPSATADDLAYVLYTSGSTGQPKGVRVTHRNLVHSTTARDEVYPEAPGRFLLLSPFAFDSSVAGIYWSLCTGGTLVLPDPGQEQDLQALLGLIRSAGVTHLLCLPAVWSLLLEEARADDLTSVRTAIVAGEACPASLVRRHFERLADATLFNEYGPTEGTVWSTVHRIRPEDADGEVPIGRPIPGTRAYVLDSFGRPVPVGVYGELYLAGAGVADGYLNRPELTAERFAPLRLAGVDEAVAYRTGDIVCIRPDGALAFAGRIDKQVKVRGHRIETEGIEAVLAGSAEVAEAAVTLLTHGASGRTALVGYLTAAPGAAPDGLSTERLRADLLERLPDFMVPDRLVVLDALPRRPGGKVDYAALPAPETDPRADSSHEAAASPGEIALAEIWSTLLGVETIGRHDDFFELGGDSILTIQMVSRAHQAGVAIEPGWVARHPTVAALAALAEESAPRETAHAPDRGEIPLLPIQRWFFEQDLPHPDHWNQSAAVELPDDLDEAALAAALQDCAARHPMLRARYQRVDGQWHQTIPEPSDDAIPLETIDPDTLPEAERNAELERRFRAAEAGVDLAVGPVARGVLRRAGTGTAPRLLLVAHHLVVDAVSWTILLGDLERAYLLRRSGQEPSFPPPAAGYGGWAVELQRRSRSDELLAQAEIWSTPAADDPDPIPADLDPGRPPTEGEARTVRVDLDADLTSALASDANRAYRTNAEELLLAGVAMALAGWTGRTAPRMALEGHGRSFEGVDLDLSRTVGWFTTWYPFEPGVAPGASAADAIVGVKERLRALPNRGGDFGLLRYLSDNEAIRGHLQATPDPRVIFNYLGRVGVPAADGTFRRLARPTAGTRHPDNTRPYLLEINVAIERERLVADWIYCETVHRRETIERVAEQFRQRLVELHEHCLSPDTGSVTQSDFPDAELDASELGSLLDRLD